MSEPEAVPGAMSTRFGHRLLMTSFSGGPTLFPSLPTRPASEVDEFLPGALVAAAAALLALDRAAAVEDAI